jgi:pseudouridine synthase
MGPRSPSSDRRPIRIATIFAWTDAASRPHRSARYLLLYKPRGYITTRSDPEQRPTVIDLLAKGGVREYVYPVGRLDYDSEGLLILTNDGELADRLTHPRHEIGREYHVRVRGVPTEQELARLQTGIPLDGHKTSRAEVTVQKVIDTAHGEDALVSIVIHEGRNRQVRRMFEAVGHPVSKLKRVRIGPIEDPHIRPGEFRDLTDREVAALRREATTAPSTEHRAPGTPPRAPGTRHPAPSTRRVTPRPAASPRTTPGPRSRGPRPSGRPRRG